MHLWPSLRIRDSFKHGYLQKLELNLGHMKRAQRQGQGQQGGGQEDQASDGKAPLLQDRSPSGSGSVLAGALELAWDAVLLFRLHLLLLLLLLLLWREGDFGEEKVSDLKETKRCTVLESADGARPIDQRNMP
ncbi:uncharacterized protein LOC120642584 isoform X2 [Panicum virgatum]|uniref:Uncharacterized protein n=1 Tax=Panicum virgatum TaxID=38727 RepID=A0A8T0QJN1_PANVG|nr:uncharacterized protein LOC120642584 isoform X2 [Panicum virgatum]KAG2573428.1 hypothetical protein PVAP13_7KG235500 [Panicum virgatum]